MSESPSKRALYLATNLFRYLALSGLNQAQLAKKVGVTAQYISQIARAKNEGPTLDFLDRLASALGTTVAELISTPKELEALRLKQHSIKDCLAAVNEMSGQILRDPHAALDELLVAFGKKRKDD